MERYGKMMIYYSRNLSNDLYEFLKTILVELYFEHNSFNSMKSQIKKLKNYSFKADVTKMYKEVDCYETLVFDDKWYLFGFNNIVYDLLVWTF